MGSSLNTISFLFFFLFRSLFSENSTIFLHLSISILSLSSLSTAQTHNLWVNANLYSWWVNLKKVKFGLMNDAFNTDNTQHTHSQNHSVPNLQCKVMVLSLSLSLSLSLFYFYIFVRNGCGLQGIGMNGFRSTIMRRKLVVIIPLYRKHFVHLYNSIIVSSKKFIYILVAC